MSRNNLIRVILIGVCFVLGLFCVIFGWTMTKQMSGLMIMILGVALILISLFLYNLPYSKFFEKWFR